MECRREIIHVAFRVTEDHAREQREERSLQNCCEKVGGIPQLADERALQEHDELVPLIPQADRLATACRCLGCGRGLSRSRRLLHVLHQAVGLVFVAPVVRRKSSRGDELRAVVFLENNIAAEIPERCFQNVKNEFRPRGSASLAATKRRSEMLLVLRFGEIFQHLVRRSEKHEFAAPVEQDGLVKHLEDFGRRLVDRHQHDLIVRHPADDLDDVLGILGRKPAGRLIEEKDVRRADHVETDVESLAFAAAQCLFVGVSNDKIPAFIESELGQFAVDPAEAFPAREVGGPDRGGEVEVFLDREVFVERVVLGDVGHVFPQRIVIGVERPVIEKDVSLVGRKLAGERAEERAFPAPARAHDANHLAALNRKRDSVNRNGPAGKLAHQIPHLQRANDIAFLLDQALREIAAQDLTDIHADHVAIRQRRGIPHRDTANEDRTVGLQNFQAAFPTVVVARDFQKHIASGTRREENVVLLEQAGIVGNKVFVLRGLELEASTVRSRPPPQIAEVELAVVVENDLVLQRGGHLDSLVEPGSPKDCIDIFQSPHLDPESERHLEARVPGAVFFHPHLVGSAHGDEKFRDRDIFLGVEIEEDVRVGEDLIVNEDTLAVIEAGKVAGLERAALHDEISAAQIFQNHQIAVAVGVEFFPCGEVHQGDIRVFGMSEAHHLERRGSGLVDRHVGLVIRIQLVDNINRLGRHPELRHERIVSNYLILLEASLGDQIVELDAEENLPLVAELAGELLRHFVEILLFVKGVPEKPAEFGINRIRIVVAEEAEAGIDFLLEQLAIRLRECGKNLDQCGKEIRALSDGAGFFLQPPEKMPGGRAGKRDAAQDSLDAPLHASRTRWCLHGFHEAPNLCRRPGHCNPSVPARMTCIRRLRRPQAIGIAIGAMSLFSKEWSFLPEAWKFALVLTGREAAATRLVSEALNAVSKRTDLHEASRTKRVLFSILCREGAKAAVVAAPETPAEQAAFFLHGLPNLPRQAITLFALGVFSGEQLARILGQSEPELARCLEEARALLRPALAPTP